MKTDTLAFGCQAYTWQMTGRHVGRLDSILDTVQAAGFSGFETEVCLLGDWYDDPARLADALALRSLAPAALTLALPWRDARETEEERREADRLFRYLAHFPGTQLVLAQLPGADRSECRERQRHALATMNALGSRAHDAGITASFHPNSPAGSVFRTWEDYQVLAEGLDSRVVGLALDAGHVAKGGMEVRATFRTLRPLLRHVHFKDLDGAGAWTAMGAGAIDFCGLVDDLRRSAYRGWIMVEEESAQAALEPESVTLANGRYVREHLARGPRPE